MKFETVQIHFLRDVLICCQPEILLPWQWDVTTSPLYHRQCRPSINLVHVKITYPVLSFSMSFSCSRPFNTLRATDDELRSKWLGLEPRRLRPVQQQQAVCLACFLLSNKCTRNITMIKSLFLTRCWYSFHVYFKWVSWRACGSFSEMIEVMCHVHHVLPFGKAISLVSRPLIFV